MMTELKALQCPRCESDDYKKDGHESSTGTQKFRCKTCGRTFLRPEDYKPRFGRKPSSETRARQRLSKLGSRNPMWKGDAASDGSARQRALRRFPAPQGYERHHLDGNPRNNQPSNIRIVTRKEHMIEDGRMDKLLKYNYSLKENIEGLVCPRCGSDRYHRGGWNSRDKQKYRCQNCDHVFLRPKDYVFPKIGISGRTFYPTEASE